MEVDPQRPVRYTNNIIRQKLILLGIVIIRMVHTAYVYVQLRAKQTAPQVNKHYGKEVTLRWQNLPLNRCKSLKS